ncbi:MAG TPA: porin family protein, partial [Fibrobacteraceae bacterium]|nr:porin family protein [Fibrobacteraceae bacterium]
GSFGVMAGLYAKVELTLDLFLRVEAMYVMKGAEYEKTLPASETYYDYEDNLSTIESYLDSGETVLDGYRRWEISAGYVEIPILLGYGITKDFSILAGPSVSYMVYHSFEAYITESTSPGETYHSTYQGKKTYTDEDPGFASLDVGMVIGANYELSDQLQLSLRYAPGFRSILKSGTDVTFGNIQLVGSFNFSDF